MMRVQNLFINAFLFSKLTLLGKWLGINDISASALLLTLANPLPPTMLMHKMDQKGRMLCIAFIISAGCLLGDHLAYTTQVAPEMCIPLMLGKFTAGVSALCLAMLSAPKLLRRE